MTLRRKTPLNAKSGLRRTTLARSREPKDASAAKRFREAVMSRCGGRCEAQAPDCDLRATQAHHVLPRGMGGGSSHDPELGLAVCDSCHGWIHANVAESYERGWLMRHGSTHE